MGLNRERKTTFLPRGVGQLWRVHVRDDLFLYYFAPFSQKATDFSNESLINTKAASVDS